MISQKYENNSNLTQGLISFYFLKRTELQRPTNRSKYLTLNIPVLRVVGAGLKDRPGLS